MIVSTETPAQLNDGAELNLAHDCESHRDCGGEKENHLLRMSVHTRPMVLSCVAMHEGCVGCPGAGVGAFF